MRASIRRTSQVPAESLPARVAGEEAALFWSAAWQRRFGWVRRALLESLAVGAYRAVWCNPKRRCHAAVHIGPPINPKFPHE